jgi:hypothetical protein
VKRLTRPLLAIALLPMLLAVAFVAGCKDDAFTVSMKGSADVTSSVSAAIQVVNDVYQEGGITKAERNDWLGYLDEATTINQEFRQNVRAIHADKAAPLTRYLDAADHAITSFDNLESSNVIRIANPSAKLRIDNVIRAIHTALTGIKAAVASAKGA